MAQELYFTGAGVSDQLSRVKFSTIRLPGAQYDDIKTGDSVVGICTDDEIGVSLRILEVGREQLKNVGVGVMALDGFMSAWGNRVEMAVTDMHTYGPRYASVDATTEMLWVAHASEERLDSLPSDLSKLLVTRPILENLKDPELRHILFPALAFWSGVRGFSCLDWINWLHSEAELVSDQEWAKAHLAADAPNRRVKSRNPVAWRRVAYREAGTEKDYRKFVLFS